MKTKPPEGKMYDALNKNKLVTITNVENDSRLRMTLWDTYRHTHKFYWKNDPSYWWKQIKGKVR